MKNFYWYIGKRISQGKGFKRGFSRPIVIIAITAVALGIGVMIIAVSIVRGFQTEVRDKVIGFGAHVQVTAASLVQSKESERLLYSKALVDEISEMPSVRHVQKFAIKPGILETKKDIEGSIIKGVGHDFDWDFFSDKLIKGRTLIEDSGLFKNTILISQYFADRLQLDVNDKVTLYFVSNQEDVKPKKFSVSGIYNSGFQEFDEQYVFVPLYILSRVSNWGIQAQVKISDHDAKTWSVEGMGYGGEGLLRYKWSMPNWRGPGPHLLRKDLYDPISLVVKDSFDTYPDTNYIRVREMGKTIDAYSLEAEISEGTYSKHCGGYEILLKDYESILNADDILTMKLSAKGYRSDTIRSRFPEIFSWLSTLDINVIVIIILMIFVAVVNMASALLIIILEKTNLIGLFRAMGSSTAQLSTIFIVVSSRIMLMGLLIGNVVGLGFCFLQDKYQLIKLDSKNYYLSSVPIELSWVNVLGINGLTLVICLLCMLIPVLYVSRIDPVRAIKFD